jgi:hypothetical protein
MRAKEISIQIKERIASRQQGGNLDGLHQQLVESGYEHVSLALRAEEHRHNSDIVLELQSYNKLIGLIPEKDDRSRASLLRYAALLDTVWQLEEALAVYRQLLKMCPDESTCGDRIGGLSERVRILETGTYIVESDVPLSVLVRAAMVLNRKLTGRYLVRAIGAPVDCNAIVSAGELVDRYEQVSRAQSQRPLPQAEEMELWWLSKEKTEQLTTVILKSEDPELFGRLELGVKFIDAHLQTVLVPLMVFNATDKAENLSVERHNKALLDQLKQIGDDSLSKGWLAVVYRSIRNAIRQVITKKLAEKNR